MNFEEVPNYDKVIFLTKDGDFNTHCKSEFKAKWERHISIEKDENNVIAEINRDYGNYIKERVIHDFAQSEYFEGYLKDELNSKSLIMVDEIEEPIREYRIENICSNVERIPPNDEGIQNILITSKIKIVYKWDDDTKEQDVVAITTLYDDDTKEIISTEYNPSLQ